MKIDDLLRFEFGFIKICKNLCHFYYHFNLDNKSVFRVHVFNNYYVVEDTWKEYGIPTLGEEEYEDDEYRLECEAIDDD